MIIDDNIVIIMMSKFGILWILYNWDLKGLKVLGERWRIDQTGWNLILWRKVIVQDAK